jgi:hypothetical protein
VICLKNDRLREYYFDRFVCLKNDLTLNLFEDDQTELLFKNRGKETWDSVCVSIKIMNYAKLLQLLLVVAICATVILQANYLSLYF